MALVEQESDAAVNHALDEMLNPPQVLMRLAESSLTVADELRDNYFKNTAVFLADLHRAIRSHKQGRRDDALVEISQVDGTTWADLEGEEVTFIDGGLGQLEFGGRMPVLLRVGSYSVRTGERNLAEREQFGYYPIVLGDLEGGSRDRPHFFETVRIIAELLGGMSALERNPNLRVLMFHGPLVTFFAPYAGQAPFTERDIDLLLHHFSQGTQQGAGLKERFLREATHLIYPRIPGAESWAQRRLFEPLAWMSFLYRQIIESASQRNPKPIVMGVVERSRGTEFSRSILLERVFDGLQRNGNLAYFNEMFDQTGLTSPDHLLEKLGYTDSFLLGLLLEPGQRSEMWEIDASSGLGSGFGDMSRAGRSNLYAFPPVNASYVHVHRTTEPIRIEVFAELGEGQIEEAARRAYLYSKLLPGYGFPIGLDIIDKYARVPAWMTRAYAKLITHHLSSSLQRGEVTDRMMRETLMQAIYMSHRDWIFRPQHGKGAGR